MVGYLIDIKVTVSGEAVNITVGPDVCNRLFFFLFIVGEVVFSFYLLMQLAN